jgi:acyl dehydratase
VEYDRVCGFRLRDVLPATYPHVLAFPLSMELMTDTSFPFPVIGLVHVGNRITQLRPIGAGERLEVHVRAGGLAPHDRGTQFQIVAEARAGDEPVWRGESTYLHREGGGGGGDGKKGARSPEVLERSAVWEVPGDTGRRYASVSGDRNPIHLHALTARLFGLPRPIAHGMWLKARCLAALESLLPEAYAADVRFKLPLYLPGKVAFGSRREDGGWAFSVSDANGGKPHLAGSVEPV